MKIGERKILNKMKDEITLDEIVEWTDANAYVYMDDDYYIGSDGEKVHEDQIIEMMSK